jgi:hypothetical protein
LSSLLFLLLLTDSLLAQYQSRIIPIEGTIAAGGNVIHTVEDGFLMQFHSFTGDDFHSGMGVIKTDFDGNLIWSNHIDSLWSGNDKHTIFEENGTIITAGDNQIDEKEDNIQIVKIDATNGNTIDVINYGADWFGERSFGLFDYPGGYILSMTIPVEEDQLYRHPVLVRFDENFNVIWEKEFDEPEYAVYQVRNAWYDSEGNIYYSGRDGFGLFNHTIVGKLSNEGDEIWHYKHPIRNEQFSGGEGLMLNNEDALLVFNRPDDETSPWDWFSRVPSLMKINFSGEFLNEFPIQNMDIRQHAGIFERENSDFIIIGQGRDLYEYHLNKFEGWIIAHDIQSNRLWQRIIIDQRFSPLDNTVVQNPLIAGVELSDGSMVFIGGITTDGTNPQYSGKFWFVHTDSEGCLEPDCGYLQIIDENGNYSTTTAVEDIQQNPENPHSIKINPNPATDEINVSLLGQHPKINQLELINAEGQVLKVYEEQVFTSEIRLDIPANANGTCYLRAFTEAGIWAKKVVILP